ncbi:MAG: DUF58 domain-containing protein [Acidobacteriota bacterium]|nr:DUF58 domain-containing protein [Acidobacteriota bacterium]
MSEIRSVADPEVLRRVRRIEIRTRRIVTESLSGTYHSAFRGRGMEFASVREYQPGDDVRSIDWNVTSRSTRPERTLFVKQFVEERELTVMLLVDDSGSTGFGTGERLKREVMAEIAALLAFAAIRNRDRVGMIRFSDRIEQYLPPRSGKTHVLRVVRDILSHEGRGRGTDLAGALSYLVRVQRKPAVVFVLSDFDAPDFERPLRLAAKRHDLIAVEVTDPLEQRVPPVGPVLFEDAETGTRRVIDTSAPGVRRALERESRARRERLHVSLDRAGADRLSVDASVSYDRPLLAFFRRRSARLSR